MQKSTATSADVGVCPLCSGTSWKETVVNGERSVKRCECFLLEQRDQLLRLSRIPQRYSGCAFSTYETVGSSALQLAKLTVETWADEYPLSKTGLLVVGRCGVGKTHLTVAALKRLTEKGVHCLFCDYRELLKQIQNSYNPSVQATELELLQPIFDTKVLLLDDLGAVKPSEWVWDTVSLILNARYNANSTTLITSNFELGNPDGNTELTPVEAAAQEETLRDRIGERMVSRLCEMCRIVVVPGKDFRQKFRSVGSR